MALATLSVDLVAKMATFERDLGKAARASEQTAARIKGAFGIIKSTAVGLGAGIGIGGLVALTRASVDSLTALKDVSEATGATIENISALERVAKLSGASLDTVSAALVKFNSSLSAAKPDSNIARALDGIGLSVAELRRLDPAEALRQTAVALSTYADDGNKARLVQELFGKSVREVGPYLKELAEQTELVATTTTEAVLEADKFNKQIFALQTNMAEMARTIVGPVISGINGLIDKFKEGSRAGESFIVTLLRQTEIARLLGLSQTPTPNTGGATGSWAMAGGGRGFVNPALVRPSVSFDHDGARVPKPRKPPNAKTQKEEITDAQLALASYVEGLSRAVERTQELSEEEQALNFLRYQGAQGQIPQVRELVLGLARQVDETKRLREETEALLNIDRALAEEEKRIAEAREARIDSLLAPTATAQLAKSREDMVFLTELFEAGRIGETQYLEAVSARLDITAEKMEKTKSLAEELGLTFTSAFEDAVIGGKKFSEVIKGIGQDILRITLRRTVTEPLNNFVTSTLGKLFSFDGGGYTGSGARVGGLDGKGGRLAMLHPQETVIDHTKGQRAGQIVVNLTTNIGDVASMSYVQAAVQRGVQAALGAARRAEGYT